MVAPKLATSRLPRSGDAPERGGRPCISEEAGVMPVRSSPLDRVNQQWEEGGLCDG